MKNDFKIIMFIVLVTVLCSVMYLAKEDTLTSFGKNKKDLQMKQKKSEKNSAQTSNINKEKNKNSRVPAQNRSNSITTTTLVDQSSKNNQTYAPTFKEQIDRYELDESNKLELAEIDYYISKNSKVFLGSLEDFNRLRDETIIHKSQGYIEYEVDKSSTHQRRSDFPVVINRDNAQVGYLTGEIAMSLDKFNKKIDGIDIVNKDTLNNRVYLKVSSMEQISLLSKEYGSDPKFFIYVHFGEHIPI